MKIDYLRYLKRRSDDSVYGIKVGGSNTVYSFKNEYSYRELCELADGAGSLFPDFFKKVFGNPSPRNYSDLGNLGRKRKVYHAESIETEINWTLLAIRKYKIQIQLFLEYKKFFENSFLLGDFETAEHYINKIEAEICFSVWSLQNRMLLLEFKESPEAQKTFLSEVNKDAKGLFVSSLAHFLSNRSERNLSVTRFDIDIRNTLQKLQGGLANSNREFYYFRLNRYEWQGYNYLKDILTYDGYHSVIDRYLTLVTALKFWLSDSEISESNKEYILHRIQYLKKKFDDPELTTMYFLYHPIQLDKAKFSFDLDVMDLFTSGLYDECINSLSEKLAQFPSQMEYYIMYVKSFLYSKKEFRLPRSGKSFQNTLLNAIYNQLNRKIDPYESMIGLQRILKNLQDFQIAGGLHKFLNDEVLNRTEWKKFDLLSLEPNNPGIAEYFEDDKSNLEYLNKLGDAYGKSISIQFSRTRYEDNYDQLIEKLRIPEIIKKIETAKRLQQLQLFDAAKEVWESVTKTTADVTPLYEIAIKNLFSVYVEIGNLNQAIDLYVNIALKANFLLAKIDTRKIHEKIRRSKFKNVNSSISLPLFYTFSSADENELHIAYERFNRSMGVERPSQISINMMDGDKSKWVEYLHQTCTTEIFKHSIYINGSKERFSERILVLQSLLLLDERHQEIYKSEINDLSDALIMQEGLQQLDESKIYVNESGLINSELKEFEGLFSRYKTIANIYKESNKKLLIIDKRRGVRLASMDDVDSIVKEQYSSDPLRDVFADIFDVITRKFLFSKFGISAYLSTRIRHGVLLGEVRPIFEKYNLISQKDSSDNKYNEIAIWNEKYFYLQKHRLSKLQQIFSIFSQTIDSAIYLLLKQQLQIKTDDEHSEGWFDYYFDDTELALHAISCMEIKEYNEFVKKIIEILWFRTDKNLIEIRSKIQVEIKAKFTEAIEQLMTSLKVEFDKSVPEIYTNISTCLTDVQNAIDRIAGWFNRSGSQTSDFKLDKLISIVLENVSHCYPNRKLSVLRFDVVDIKLRGEFYTHFADLFRIFLDNAFKHSDPAIDIIGVEITVSEDSGKLMATIKNDAGHKSFSSDVVDLKNTDLNIKKLVTEGKSGFPKAEKIISSDLKNEANSFSIGWDEKGQFTVIVNLVIDNLIA